MCGFIATTIVTDPKALAASVQHRGTWEPRIVQRGDFVFIHALMPVQGNEPVLQPYTEGKDDLLLFQGELWKHPGYDSDTKYLYNHLRTAGPKAKAVAALEGMFAFVYDDGRHLWFASDIFGEQPLYYHHKGGSGFFQTLAVGSEMKQLRACGVPLKWIKPCLPGRLYRFTHATGALEEEVYHAFDYEQERTTEMDHAHLRALVEASCKAKYQAVSLQDVALLLSGGVDSAIMAHELSKFGLRRAFTVSIDPDSIDFRTAKKTAARNDLKLTKVLARTLDPDLSIAVSESKNRSVVEEYVCHLGLARCLAEEGVRVVFTGSGADELFCGYPYYLRFTSRKDPASMARMQEKLVEGYHSRELRILNKVYMSQAVEVRSPFLDKALAHYATTLDVNECMVAKGRMKAILRDAYEDDIESAQNEKIIAGRSMGVIDHFAELNGGMEARVYHPRFKEIFSNNDELFRMLARAGSVEYEVLP